MEVRAGLTSKEIAYELGISESTVNKHVAAALRRLGARSRSQAVALLGEFLDGERPGPGTPPPGPGAGGAGFATAAVRALAVLLEADYAYYAAWDPAAGQLRVLAACGGPALREGQVFESGSGLAGVAFQRGRVFSSADYARLRSAHPDAVRLGAASGIGAPIHAGEEVVGALAVGSETPLHFTPLHVELLALAARLLSARLLAATRRRGLAVVPAVGALGRTRRASPEPPGRPQRAAGG